MKIKSLVSLVLVLCFACSIFAGCSSEPVVIKDSETCIVISADKDAASLLDYMAELKNKGQLDYTVENGMVMSVNGIENPADFSSCWMLYTSDAENASEMYGTVEYNGKIYGSAVVGAETLAVKEGQLYIWVFKSFS